MEESLSTFELNCFQMYPPANDVPLPSTFVNCIVCQPMLAPSHEIPIIHFSLILPSHRADTVEASQEKGPEDSQVEMSQERAEKWSLADDQLLLDWFENHPILWDVDREDWKMMAGRDKLHIYQSFIDEHGWEGVNGKCFSVP